MLSVSIVFMYYMCARLCVLLPTSQGRKGQKQSEGKREGERERERERERGEIERERERERLITRNDLEKVRSFLLF